jgi:signal transduction histidine kinase
MVKVLVKKTDLYYIIATICIICFFGIWVIPTVLKFLVLRAIPDWLIIIIVAGVIPLVAIILLWLIIQEIQQHFKQLSPIESKKEEPFLMKDVFTEADEKFIEEKMKTQLETHEFEDEDNFERNYDLILSYMRHSLNASKVISLQEMVRELDLPLDVIKDIILLLIADGLLYGKIKDDSFEGST